MKNAEKEDDNVEKENGCTNKKKGRKYERDNGFSDWGGYNAAKRAKLLDQFENCEIKQISNIFQDIAIHVNGFTKPPIDELKNLMAAHGGQFHLYQLSTTTHIIASNLPNVKIKHLGTTPIVKPNWITDSIDFGKLLDYRRYLLYSNQSKSQPRIDFPILNKVSNAISIIEDVEIQKNTVTVKQDELKSEKETDISSCINDISGNRSVASSSTDKIVSCKKSEQTKLAAKTASDPNFLEEFYNNSRLHLISTLGAEFKQLVGQLRDASDGKFPGTEKLLLLKGQNSSPLMSRSVIMHIDMDCFFVSVSIRNHPELKGKPVAITHARNGQITNVKPEQKAIREQEFALYSERLPLGMTSRVEQIDTFSSMSEIASCSYEARKYGIKNGTFLGQAIKVCPNLVTLPYDFEGIKEVSHNLYKTIASYTLDIEAVSCDEMYVDITKILQETGLSVEEWAVHIRKEIMNVTGCPCSTGFGANRLQARLATKKAKPEGQFYLKPDAVEQYMMDVALSDLPGVGRATLAKLHKLGLNSCGDLQLVSSKILQNELGQKAGETIKQQSMGIDTRPLNFHHERKSVSAEVNYGIRFKTIKECYSFIQNLAVEIHNRINDIKMRARCLTLKLLVRAPEAPVETAKFLGHGICDSLTKSTTSNAILNNPQVIFNEAKSLYEKLGVDFADLRGVGLQLTKLEKNAPINKALSNFLKQEVNTLNQFDKIKDLATISNKIIDSKQSENTKGLNSNLDRNIMKTSTGARRGRPKGSNKSTNNGNRLSKNVRNNTVLHNYFDKKKSVEPRIKPTQNVHHKIDINVLNELPEGLRDEIIKEYKLNIKVKDKPQTKPDIKSNQLVQTEDTENVTTKNNKSENVQTSPFSNLTWDQIKPIIKKWTESEESPSDTDIEMIAIHFKLLAVNRQIEILMSVFNFLYRMFASLNCNWHQAYFKIVNTTQEGMVARYGHTLLVQRQFPCCKM
ncbi:DNA repair protein REV1 [Diorhabda carinulata]|uniref:DNA repair protein REV1 n=1 Tax=Diorhabda carinulata TaxID=1163345 RepID=UPI0025A2BC85|nr:DNA repair protein REV1 [Diorhabda carinulata]XP_057670737.1 DNA repair protein REV1 [Diorhabda carinulata]